jgi:hypoxanthine phosphoribosyltransferase
MSTHFHNPKHAIKRILFSKEQIDTRIQQLAEQINKDYEGKEVVVIGILKGAFIFLADLTRKLEVDHMVDLMALSSYGDSTSSSGNVRITLDLRKNIEGKHVLIVEG